MGVLLRGDPAPVNPVFQATGYDQLGTGYALGAAGAQSLSETPTADLARTFEIGEAERGPIIAGGRGGVMRGEPETPLLEAKQANELYGIQGELTWDQPVREGVAKLQNEFALDRLKRADQLNRAQSGALPATARFLTTLGVQALDPVNVASSFIPVVGEARFAALAGRVGIYGARAVRGVAEGAVGQALLEPITAQNADAENRDYTAYDSLVNIAMGAGIGAGLHVGGGILKDRFTRNRLHGVPEFTPPAQREAALRGAVAAISEGRPVRVAEYLRLAEAAGQRDRLMSGSAIGDLGRPTVPEGVLPVPETPRILPEQPITPGFKGEIVLPTVKPSGETAVFPADTLGFRSEIKRLTDAAEAIGQKLELRPAGEGNHLVEPAQFEVVEQFGDERAAAAAVKRLPPAEREGLQVVPFTRDDGNRGGAIVRGLDARQAEAVKAQPELMDQAIQRAREPVPDQAALTVPDLPTAPQDFATAWRDMVNTQRQTHEIQPEEAAILQEQARVTKGFDRPATPEQDLSELESLAAQADEVIALARAEGRMTEEFEAALADAEQGIAEAEKQGMGLRAAAACIGRALL